MKNRKMGWLMVLSLLIASSVVAFANTSSSPTSDGGVTPLIIDGENSGGNITCSEVGLAFFNNADYYDHSSDKIDYDKDSNSFDDDFPAGLSVSVTDKTYVSFNSSFGIGAVIVKGGNKANVYIYDPQRKSDSGLASPPNPSGKPAGLSNITFCWNPEPVVEGQWCSPGYWRQEHHLGSWAATGIAPGDFYSDHFDDAPPVSKLGKRAGAETDPTLWQVLQSPQWYGGDAFNNVGDLLSTAHPDVDFDGERVEDSCPLGRSE
jgi:hypothetical protein